MTRMLIPANPADLLEVYNFQFQCIEPLINFIDYNELGIRINDPQTSSVQSEQDVLKNTQIVQDFLNRFLDGYIGVDGRGSKFVSVVDCLIGCAAGNVPIQCYFSDEDLCIINRSLHTLEHPCARFLMLPDQQLFLFIYGQGYSLSHPTQLISCASSLTTVAHEIFHAVTYFLGYNNKLPSLAVNGVSGSLNESYSDIFAIIVANSINSISSTNNSQWDWSQWDWNIYDLDTPLRNLMHPEYHSQARTMDGYDKRNNPNVKYYNHGIHNLAAYMIITARNRSGSSQYLFYDDVQGQVDVEGITELFYRGLKGLAWDANFTESRTSLYNTADILFKTDPRQSQIKDAINRAFEFVRIPAVANSNTY
jgi:hypothetical protein